MEGQIIAFLDSTGSVRASRNQCRHERGRFQRNVLDGKCLKCPNHGWILDLERMEYINPSGGIRQDTLHIERDGESLLFFEDSPNLPWKAGARTKSSLSPGELTVKFYSHACAEITGGRRILFTDPWLVGPAFSRGWWLEHNPPPDWLEKLASADIIYVSHNHTDHLNPHTFRRLRDRNPDARICAPDFPSRSCEKSLRVLGFRNLLICRFGEWQELDADFRFMILPDATGRDDSGLLIDYKGTLLLNTVDCSNLNGGTLPENVDVLFTSFAGGASGYPVCWKELYGAEKVRRTVEKNRILMRQETVNAVTKSKPSLFIPFAGYFTEAHPADAEIQAANVKNSAQEVCDHIAALFPGTKTWAPVPGAVLDVSDHHIASPSLYRPPTAEDYGFEGYIAEIAAAMGFGPLRDLAGIKAYFDWSGYRGDLILHVLETDEGYAEILREFIYDFKAGSFLSGRPVHPHRYLRIKVRADVFRYVLMHGMSWEEISIGFQARFYRDPDVYNFDFWKHFQDLLPETPPFPMHSNSEIPKDP